MKAINHTPYANPNTNYRIMSNLINISREAYIPTKMVKFKKYKHKKMQLDHYRNHRIY